MPFKLGKLAPKHNPKTLRFSAFLRTDAPPPPPERTFLEYKIPPATIGMYGNDQFGDCTCAMVAHWLMLITAHSGTLVVPSEDEVIAMYQAVCPGFDPATDANDNGAALTDVLNYWQTVGLAGHKIDGWAQIDNTNMLHRNQAQYLFYGVGVGVQLPSAAQGQFTAGQDWDVVPGDSIEGGHAILESGYGARGRNFETWGKGDQKGTNAWDAAYTDETYIVLTPDLIEQASDLSPNGMNYAALTAILAELRA